MKHKMENPKEEGHTPENALRMSRREFLRKSGSAAIGAGAFLLNPLEGGRAHAAEVKEGMSWVEGIQALRDDVLTNYAESFAFYVEHGDIGAWDIYNMSQGTALISKKTFSRILKERGEEGERVIIKIAHTHPLSVFTEEWGLSWKDASVLRKGDVPPHKRPSMPPSIDLDLPAGLKAQKMAGSDATVFSVVVDPRGVWEYTIDPNHEYAQLVLAIVDAQTQLEMNPKAQNIFRTQGVEFLEESLREKVERALELQKMLYKKYNTPLQRIAHSYIQASMEGGSADSDSLIKEYKKLGVALSFQTFEEMGVK